MSSSIIACATALVIQSRQRFVVSLSPLPTHRLTYRDSLGAIDPSIEVIERHSSSPSTETDGRAVNRSNGMRKPAYRSAIAAASPSGVYENLAWIVSD
ncbi:hypothetical protein PFZ49_16500 [Microbacterium lacticum]|uniref:hypothetical protein n=1 Tax=Microbacterium lacticum TaxID=33885 RepID=UPI003A83D8D6